MKTFPLLLVILSFHFAFDLEASEEYQTVSWAMVQSGKVDNGKRISIDGWLSITVGATGTRMLLYRDVESLVQCRAMENLTLSGQDLFFSKTVSLDHLTYQRFQNCYVRISATLRLGEEVPRTSSGVLANCESMTIRLLPEETFLELVDKTNKAESSNKKALRE